MSELQALADRSLSEFFRGRFREARDLQERAMRDLALASAQWDDDTLRAMNALASALWYSNDLDAAVQIQQRVVRALETRTDGQSLADLLVAVSNLSSIYLSQGRLDEALALDDRVLSVRTARLPQTHPELLSSKAAKAATLCEMGDFLGARKLEEEVLAAHRSAPYPDESMVCRAMGNLAVTLQFLGDLKGAKSLQEQVLDTLVRRHGPSHPDTLGAMGNLASTLHESGEFGAAERLKRAVLDARLVKDDSGEDHNSLETLSSLAATLRALGRLDEARSMNEHVLSVRRRSRGAGAPDTLRAMDSLTRTLQVQRDWPAASTVLKALVEGLTGEHVQLSIRLADVIASVAKRLRDLPDHTIPFDWRHRLRALNLKWLDTLDLAPLSRERGLATAFVDMHSAWLELCVRNAQQEIPVVLSSLQGREMSHCVFTELESRRASYRAEDARSLWVSAMARLRSVRLRQKALQEARDGSEIAAGAAASRAPHFEGMSETSRQALERHLQEQHDLLAAELKPLRTRIGDEMPMLGFALRPPQETSDAIGARLAGDEAVLLVFMLRREDGPAACMAQVIVSSGSTLVDAPELSRALGANEIWQTDMRGPMGRGMRGVAIGPEASSASPGGSSAASPDPATVEQEIDGSLESLRRSLCSFWAKLIEANPTIRRWHVVTHQSLHALPLQSAAPPQIKAYIYPGLPFYQQYALDIAPGVGGGSPGDQLLLHVDASEQGSPIPLVEAEAALIQSLRGDARITHGIETLSALAPESGAAMVCFLAHGMLVGKPGHRQAVVFLDADAHPPATLDAQGWIATGVRPKLVLHSCCVAATVDEALGGEPFGLASAMLMQGCTAVVGALAPVPDFYTPLLSGLYMAVLDESVDSLDALRRAKARLRDGNWPAGMEAKVRAAYGPVMLRILERAMTDIRCARGVSAWPLADRTAREFFWAPLMSHALWRRFCVVHCRTAAAREALVYEALDRLTSPPRRLPEHIVDHLDMWFVSYGPPRSVEPPK